MAEEEGGLPPDRASRTSTTSRADGSDRDDRSRGDEGESSYSGRGSDFDEEVYPRSYPVPGRINLKRAMRAYVRGHDRGWEAHLKAGLADEEEGYQGPGQAIRSGEQQPAPGEASGDEPDRTSGTGCPEAETPRYGVGVPDRLSFHRSADTWRRRLPESRAFRRWRRPEKTAEPGEESGGGERQA